VRLTELGAAWLPSVQRALEAVDVAVADLQDLARRSVGHLRFGYLIGTGADLLFRILEEFERAYPTTVIEAVESDFADPTAGLGDRLTDIALIRPPVDLPGHRMLILAEEAWVACLPRSHALAEREDVELAELLDQPIICAPASAGIWRDYWMAMDARAGKPPVIGGVAGTYEAETTMISRGLGISFTTEATARLYTRPGISYVPIRDHAPNYTALAWNPERLTREANAMVRLAHENWALHYPGRDLPPDLNYR
jgi:DNA-binding transcriptional LysR family regulator